MTGRVTAARPPLVGGVLWTAVLQAAGDRCECVGHCGSEHTSGLGRCPHTSASKHGLQVAPIDPLTPLPVATNLPASKLRAWCPGCLTAATRAARRDTASGPVADQPDLFGDIA